MRLSGISITKYNPVSALDLWKQEAVFKAVWEHRLAPLPVYLPKNACTTVDLKRRQVALRVLGLKETIAPEFGGVWYDTGWTRGALWSVHDWLFCFQGTNDARRFGKSRAAATPFFFQSDLRQMSSLTVLGTLTSLIESAISEALTTLFRFIVFFLIYKEVALWAFSLWKLLELKMKLVSFSGTLLSVKSSKWS